MVTTTSTELSAGTLAPALTLADARTDKAVSLSDFSGKPIVVIFMCNHCPYVVHIVDALIKAATDFEKLNVATIAISANDVINYPQDAPDKMAALAAEKAFPFPYLFDKDQSIARAFKAVCTPDIYLFDENHRLYYRGQFDDSRPNSGTLSTGNDLRAAVHDLLARKTYPAIQKPSVGCSIKWLATA